MRWTPRTQMSIDAQSKKLERQRRRNPIREARRQANLSRMGYRGRIEYVPMYREVFGGNGDVVAQVYLGHKPVNKRA